MALVPFVNKVIKIAFIWQIVKKFIIRVFAIFEKFYKRLFIVYRIGKLKNV